MESGHAFLRSNVYFIQHGILVLNQSVAVESYCFFLLINSILMYKTMPYVYIFMAVIPGVSRQILYSFF